MRKSCAQMQSEAGFTIVELMVSLALLALILLLLPGAVRTGHRGWETAAVIDAREASRASIDFLRQRLAEASTRFETADSGLARLAFKGEVQRLSFVAPAPTGPYGGGLYRFTVVAAQNAGDSTLDIEVRMKPFRSSAQDAALPEHVHQLIGGVQGLSMRYFGPQIEGDPSSWSEAWPRYDRLPNLVEINAIMANGDPQSLIKTEIRLQP
jgi:general secretion pathway protein J